MRLNLAGKIVYPIVITGLFFALLEFLLFLVGFSGRADDTRFVLNPEWDYPEFFDKDHDLFWKFRPNQVMSIISTITGCAGRIFQRRKRREHSASYVWATRALSAGA